MWSRAGLVLISVAIMGTFADARADQAPASPRRHTGTRIMYVGLAASLTGVALGAFAVGLGNDRPDAAVPFYAASGVTLGLGALALASGSYLRATSPAEAPDAISLDPVRARHRNERRVGIALIGAGAAITLTGLAHAVGAYRDQDLADAQCPGGACNADGARLVARSHTLGLAADMLVGTGVIGLAGGIILYRGGRDGGPRVVPVIGPREAGAAIFGHF